MPEDVTLILAQATVHEKVDLAHEPPAEVDLQAGDTLRARLAYRIHDQTKPEELWTFRLMSRVDDDDEAVSERIHRDRKFLADHVISHVGTEMEFPTAGEFTLSYEVFAQVAHRDWDDRNKFEPISSETRQGEVKVRVH